NVYWKQQPDVEVVAFTATQIPNIDGRTYPASLAGPRYPQGVAIHPESQLEELIQKLQVDVVSYAYSDVSYDHVMHQAARTQAAGASFQVLGPRQTWLESKRPVIAVGAVRTGSGKSQTSRYVAGLLRELGVRVAVVRHPMPYGDLVAQAVQRFATIEDLT